MSGKLVVLVGFNRTENKMETLRKFERYCLFGLKRVSEYAVIFEQ